MPFKLTPLKLQPIFREMVWGGHHLSTMFQADSSKPIGEAWILSDFGDRLSLINEGPHSGKTLQQVLEEHGTEPVLGSEVQPSCEGRFPLLIKLLDVNGVLSVQVHPGEDDIGESKKAHPKSEMWHFLDTAGESAENTRIVYGLNRILTREELHSAVTGDDLTRYLNDVTVFAGDTVYIPPGTLHTISGNALLYEVQLTSDTTYRLYDWGRLGMDGKPRELHVEDGVRVAHLEPLNGVPLMPIGYDIGENRIIFLGATRFFTLLKFVVNGSLDLDTGERTFYILTCISGKGSLHTDGENYPLTAWDTMLVPGCTGPFALSSEKEMVLLASSVYDLRRDVIEPLTKQGFSSDEIASLGGPRHANDLIPILSEST